MCIRDRARLLAQNLAVGDLLILTGDLGAGKTCFTQGLGSGLGVTDRITSPTFTLASRYQGRLLLHHLDAYRLDTLGEALDLDLPELLDSGVTVVEWGELLTPVLPDEHLLIAIEYQPVEPDTSRPASDSNHESVDEPSTENTEEVRLLRMVANGQRWVSLLPAIASAYRAHGYLDNATSETAQ